MIHQLQIIFFFCPFGILQYKFLSYREVLHVLSESSELSQLSELIELPEVFSSMKKCLFCGALRLGDPLIKLLELRFVSSSSETSRSSGTIQTSQSSISSHPVFPDAGMMEKILISLSVEPLVQAGSEDIPAEESMVTNAVMTAELEGITPASGWSTNS